MRSVGDCYPDSRAEGPNLLLRQPIEGKGSGFTISHTRPAPLQSGVNHKKAGIIRNTMNSTGSLPMAKTYVPATYSAPTRARPLNPMNSDRGRKTSASIATEVHGACPFVSCVHAKAFTSLWNSVFLVTFLSPIPHFLSCHTMPHTLHGVVCHDTCAYDVQFRRLGHIHTDTQDTQRQK